MIAEATQVGERTSLTNRLYGQGSSEDLARRVSLPNVAIRGMTSADMTEELSRYENPADRLRVSGFMPLDGSDEVVKGYLEKFGDLRFLERAVPFSMFIRENPGSLESKWFTIGLRIGRNEDLITPGTERITSHHLPGDLDYLRAATNFMGMISGSLTLSNLYQIIVRRPGIVTERSIENMGYLPLDALLVLVTSFLGGQTLSWENSVFTAFDNSFLLGLKLRLIFEEYISKGLTSPRDIRKAQQEIEFIEKLYALPDYVLVALIGNHGDIV